MWMLHDVPLRRPVITHAWDVALSHSSQTQDTLSQDPAGRRYGAWKPRQPKMSGGTPSGADELRAGLPDEGRPLQGRAAVAENWP